MKILKPTESRDLVVIGIFFIAVAVLLVGYLITSKPVPKKQVTIGGCLVIAEIPNE